MCVLSPEVIVPSTSETTRSIVCGQNHSAQEIPEHSNSSTSSSCTDSEPVVDTLGVASSPVRQQLSQVEPLEHCKNSLTVSVCQIIVSSSHLHYTFIRGKCSSVHAYSSVFAHVPSFTLQDTTLYF